MSTNLTQPHSPVKDGCVAGLLQERSAASLAVETLTLTLLGLLSLGGNLLVCLVVHRSRRIQSTTNYFVVALALADLVLAALCLPLVLARVLAGSWEVGEVLCKVVRFLQQALPAAALLVLLSICVDRFYTIIYPLSFKVTRGTAKRMILGSWAAAGLCSSLCFYFFSVVTVSVTTQPPPGDGGDGDGGRYVLQRGGEGSDEVREVCPTLVPCGRWGGVAYVLLLVLLQFLLPVLVLGVLYGRVVRYIWRAGTPGIRAIQRTGNPVPRAKVKMVKMLLLVTACSVLMVAPFYGLQLAYCLNSGRMVKPQAFLFAFSCLVATAAAKPLLYLRYNPNFRRGCKEVLCMSAMRCYRSHTYAITSTSMLAKKNHVGVLTTSTTGTTTSTTTCGSIHVMCSGDVTEPSAPACYDSPLQAFNRAWHLEKTAWPLNGASSPSTYL